MKVIQVDNFDRDNIPDMLVEGPGLTKEEADWIASDLNSREGPHTDRYFLAVPDEYKLKTWEP